jgi:hypothetical protein
LESARKTVEQALGKVDVNIKACQWGAMRRHFTDLSVEKDLNPLAEALDDRTRLRQNLLAKAKSWLHPSRTQLGDARVIQHFAHFPSFRRLFEPTRSSSRWLNYDGSSGIAHLQLMRLDNTQAAIMAADSQAIDEINWSAWLEEGGSNVWLAIPISRQIYSLSRVLQQVACLAWANDDFSTSSDLKSALLSVCQYPSHYLSKYLLDAVDVLPVLPFDDQPPTVDVLSGLETAPLESKAFRLPAVYCDLPRMKLLILAWELQDQVEAGCSVWQIQKASTVLLLNLPPEPDIELLNVHRLLSSVWSYSSF